MASINQVAKKYDLTYYDFESVYKHVIKIIRAISKSYTMMDEEELTDYFIKYSFDTLSEYEMNILDMQVVIDYYLVSFLNSLNKIKEPISVEEIKEEDSGMQTSTELTTAIGRNRKPPIMYDVEELYK